MTDDHPEANRGIDDTKVDPQLEESLESPRSSDGPEPPGSDSDEASSDSSATSREEESFDLENETDDDADPRTRVLSVLELEALFIQSAPDLSCKYLSF